MNLVLTLALTVILAVSSCRSTSNTAAAKAEPEKLEPPELQVGDIVFTRLDNPFGHEIAQATGSWLSHVGVIVDATPGAEKVAESRIPFSSVTTLEKFIARSENGMYAIKRPRQPLSDSDKIRLCAEATARMGKLYHLGFKYDSSRQYCSKFVHDVYASACGMEVGKVQTLSEVLAENPDVPRIFWDVWYLGFIPWERRIVTPVSQYRDTRLITVCEYLPGLEKS